MDPLATVPGALARVRELMALGATEARARTIIAIEFGLSAGDDEAIDDGPALDVPEASPDLITAIPDALDRLAEFLELGADEAWARELVALEFGLSQGDEIVISEDEGRRWRAVEDPLETTPGAMERFEHLLAVGFERGSAREIVLFELGLIAGDKIVLGDDEPGETP